tara:strand:+ start:345 stop:548 length:204 start_codon:yes stop_codon:yes gene_type:complete
MSNSFIKDLEELEKIDMNFSDKFAARIMLITQNKVRKVNANEDFKNWSLTYIVSITNNHAQVVIADE